MANPTNPLTLAHWRRSVAEIYSAVRWTPLGKQPRIWKQFRAVRDDLFANHPDSPLSTEQRAQFTGLNYYPYDPSWRVLGDVEPAVERDTFAVDLPVDGPLHYMRVAWICFMLQGQAATLNGRAVTDGQEVAIQFKRRGSDRFKVRRGILVLQTTKAVLTVTATDASGNSGSASAELTGKNDDDDSSD